MAVIHLPPDFKEFLKLLNLKKLEYLLVGGYAVSVITDIRALWATWTFVSQLTRETP